MKGASFSNVMYTSRYYKYIVQFETKKQKKNENRKNIWILSPSKKLKVPCHIQEKDPETV